MIEQVNRLKELQSEVLSSLETYLTDKTIPLDERWDCAIEAQPFMQHCSYCYSGIDHLVEGDISWNDDFYLDRYAHEVLVSNDFIEMCEERLKFKEGVTIADFKEAILADGYGSFCYDW